jgi:hypothetical protein
MLVWSEKQNLQFLPIPANTLKPAAALRLRLSRFVVGSIEWRT